MKNEVIEHAGRNWLVREAVSRMAAINAIDDARISGSVGSKNISDKTMCGGGVVVLADVVQINSDGTERQPYTDAY